MKRLGKWLLTIGIAILGIYFAANVIVAYFLLDIERPDFLYHPVDVTDQSVVIDNAEFYTANSRQDSATVKMYSSAGKLYFFPKQRFYPFRQTKYHNYLCVFDNDGAERIMFYSSFGQILGCANGYLYYVKMSDDYDLLYCYNLATGSHTYLNKADYFYPANSYFTEDGTFHASTNQEGTEFITVYNDQMLESKNIPEMYELNGLLYTTENGSAGNADVVYYDESGTRYSLKDELPYGPKTLLPCKQGLLIFVADEGNMLYLISNQSNELIQLFSVKSAGAISTVNVHNNYAYLSFIRFKEYTSLGAVRYKNDDIAGTYRVDLENHTSEKISDKSFDGLYIFDNSGIFACDEYCNIYKLDFDGNIIMTLLEQ